MKSIWLLALADLFNSLVVIFLFLLTLSVAAINVEKKQADNNVPKDTTYLIKLLWPGESASDLDLYVSGPGDRLVYFKRLQDGLISLERDDTGSESNIVHLPDGSVVKSAENQENVDIRGGVVSGEYVVNVHAYRMTGDPVSAEVDIYRIAGGSGMPVHKQILTFDHQGQEETAFRFTLLPSGEIADINRLPKKLTNPK